jgi:hypothetical protein
MARYSSIPESHGNTAAVISSLPFLDVSIFADPTFFHLVFGSFLPIIYPVLVLIILDSFCADDNLPAINSLRA